MIDKVALWAGYVAIGFIAVIAVLASIEIRLGRPAYMVLVLGFGPVWFNANKHLKLYQNMTIAGYRLARCGRWAVGFSVPKWARRLA